MVFVSSATIAIEPQTTIGRWHLEAEVSLDATGLQWTVLRPGNFASNALLEAGMPLERVDPVLELIRPGREGRSGPLTAAVEELTRRRARRRGWRP